jgi:hypothetical protein
LHETFHFIYAFLRDHTARTPLVLGTSLPPVRVMAMRMARARALKAASALAMSEIDHRLQIKLTCGGCSRRGSNQREE